MRLKGRQGYTVGMIEGIIFDCFGVLYRGSLTLLASMAPEGREQEVYDINLQKDYGYISYDEHLEQTAAVIGKTAQEVEVIMRKKQLRNDELVAYVRELKATGKYRMGMLSNIGERTIQQLFGDELHELFDTVVLSYQEGLAKPNPAIFTLTAERMGLPEGRCVMIDDLADNCEGAEVAGMASIQHTSNARTKELLRNLLQKQN